MDQELWDDDLWNEDIQSWPAKGKRFNSRYNPLDLQKPTPKFEAEMESEDSASFKQLLII
ncbi:hypothetical protein OnM2_012007 [Erysiphe neolycopersici]|uniref:Uncharacterized protein n=1 Tax=Erysiphe neolycopersici TaxID=212602 RepID=A0A420I637_9PEZI|nr:hypothetical protein OnM2_012007 [Erysiphe neolycopersici]